MRATFRDADDPRLRRVLPVLPALFGCAAFFFIEHAFMPFWLGGIALFLAGAIGLIPSPVGAKSVELVLGPGYVDVRKGRRRIQRIHAQSIVGASTARTSRGVLLSLAHDRREQPLMLEVETEADAAAVRRAMGVGHDGFGALTWGTRGTSAFKSGMAARFVLAGSALLVGAIACTSGAESAAVTALALAQFVLIAVIFVFAGMFKRRSEPTVIVTSEGVKALTSHGWFMMPWTWIRGVTTRGKDLVFSVPEPYQEVVVVAGAPYFGGLGAADLRALRAQIASATKRAGGLGLRKEDVAARLEVLRRNGENSRAWLARLDVAGRLLNAPAGYRGQTLDVQDLWATVEDPDSDAELRAAAMRVLRHSAEPEARTRIDAAVATVRDETVVRRLRIAVDDDLDSASEELARLDDEGRRQAQAR